LHNGEKGKKMLDFSAFDKDRPPLHIEKINSSDKNIYKTITIPLETLGIRRRAPSRKRSSVGFTTNSIAWRCEAVTSACVVIIKVAVSKLGIYIYNIHIQKYSPVQFPIPDPYKIDTN
jgi:hypothetical protein